MNGITRVVAIATAVIFCVSGIAQAENMPANTLALTAAVSPLIEDVSADWPILNSYRSHELAGSQDAEPVKALAASLPDLVGAHMQMDVADAEHECLAGAVYFESKGEPLTGQLAVAEVILNRAKSGKYPPTVCGVVKQGGQFSFVRGGRIPPVRRNSDAWRKAVAVAHVAKADLADGGIGQAMFFHARYVAPKWNRLTRVASIGNHVFYSH